jgi:DeoR/GlpR family transcriptional regulator of sugar metabolism
LKENEEMMSNERYSIILEQLKKRQIVNVIELSRQFEVSENTIRRDLGILEKQGKLHRVQGGAILSTTPKIGDIDFKTYDYLLEKQSIAKRATQLIMPNMSIIVDTGTTTEQMIPYLQEKDSLTIITNSLSIGCMKITSLSTMLVLSGGVVDQYRRSVIGRPAEDFFETVHADILFLGAKALMNDTFSNENLFETPVKQKMLKAATKSYLLIDHSKFGKHGMSDFGNIEQLTGIITDAKTDKKYIDYLLGRGIEVIIAEV